MAAPRFFQTVKPHIPLIKFPHRTKEAATTIAPTLSKLTNQQPQPSQSSSQRAPSLHALDFLDLPAKYQRQPISPEEMAYIEVYVSRLV